jgi:hypothetical protein
MIMAKQPKVVIHLPETVLLSRRGTQNSIRISVVRKGAKEGDLVVAQGSVEWWPEHRKVNAHRMNWDKFIRLLEEDMPPRRSKRSW